MTCGWPLPAARSAFLCGAVGAALYGAAIGSAAAAVSVIGRGDAYACFEAARSGAAGRLALNACDAALQGFLGEEERAATLVNRGVLRLQRREAELALADFDAALALRPGLGEAHVNRGAALILLDRPNEALAAIDTGLALGSADPHEAYFNRAIAAEALGDLQTAYHDYQRARALAPAWLPPQVELARFTVQPASPP